MSVSVAHSLLEARERGVERLDAQLLLARLLDQPRSWLLAHDDALLSADQASGYRSLLTRRAAGEPLAYLLGEKEFHGLMLRVDADVLVPRPDTETLVDWAIELLATDLAGVQTPRVLDLGTGSGAIALAIKHAVPNARVDALDASDAALAVAESNARRLGLRVGFSLGHWWQSIGEGRFDLALSNPPYIADGDDHLPALAHEPRAALVSGPEGLDAIREISAHAPSHLNPGGWLLLEHGHKQARPVQALLASAGFINIQTRRDIAGVMRCTGGRISRAESN